MLTAMQHFIFVDLTSWLAILGGLGLWLGFIFMGITARRFEQAFGQSTHWLYLMVAPAGAVAYLCMQSIASMRHENMGPIEQWTGYTMLIWSALLCAWGVYRFGKMLAALAKPGE